MDTRDLSWKSQMTSVSVVSTSDGAFENQAVEMTGSEEGQSAYRMLLRTPASTLLAPMDDHAHCFHAAVLGYN